MEKVCEFPSFTSKYFLKRNRFHHEEYLLEISFRGGMTGGSCPSKDNWKFDATKEDWTRLEECSTPRMYSSMAMLPPLSGDERRAVLYGGAETSKSVLVVSKVCAEAYSMRLLGLVLNICGI